MAGKADAAEPLQFPRRLLSPPEVEQHPGEADPQRRVVGGLLEKFGQQFGRPRQVRLFLALPPDHLEHGGEGLADAAVSRQVRQRGLVGGHPSHRVQRHLVGVAEREPPAAEPLLPFGRVRQRGEERAGEPDVGFRFRTGEGRRFGVEERRRLQPHRVRRPGDELADRPLHRFPGEGGEGAPRGDEESAAGFGEQLAVAGAVEPPLPRGGGRRAEGRRQGNGGGGGEPERWAHRLSLLRKNLRENPSPGVS